MILLDNLPILSCHSVMTYLDCLKYYLLENILGHKINQCLPFPPEVFLDAGSHGRHEVVEVHDDVNPHVQEPAEGGVAAANKPANGHLATTTLANTRTLLTLYHKLLVSITGANLRIPT